MFLSTMSNNGQLHAVEALGGCRTVENDFEIPVHRTQERLQEVSLRATNHADGPKLTVQSFHKPRYALRHAHQAMPRSFVFP